MRPALNTAPVAAMPAITRVVKPSRGSAKGTMPHASKRGTGTQRKRNVQTPMSDVSKLGYRPNGRG